MDVVEVSAGTRFTIPTREVRNQHGDWVSLVYRVNRVTKTGTVYFGYDGESRSGSKIDVAKFHEYVDSGYYVVTP